MLPTCAFIIEHFRRSPPLQTGWRVSVAAIHFHDRRIPAVFFDHRAAFGEVTLMRTPGMAPDQVQPLFAVILVGTVIGILASAISYGPKTLFPQLLITIVLLGSAALLDESRTRRDRRYDLLESQFLASNACPRSRWQP